MLKVKSVQLMNELSYDDLKTFENLHQVSVALNEATAMLTIDELLADIKEKVLGTSEKVSVAIQINSKAANSTLTITLLAAPNKSGKLRLHSADVNLHQYTTLPNGSVATGIVGRVIFRTTQKLDSTVEDTMSAVYTHIMSKYKPEQ